MLNIFIFIATCLILLKLIGVSNLVIWWCVSTIIIFVVVLITLIIVGFISLVGKMQRVFDAETKIDELADYNNAEKKE